MGQPQLCCSESEHGTVGRSALLAADVTQPNTGLASVVKAGHHDKLKL